MVPILTAEQRRESLAKGLQIRSRRASYRAALKDGSMNPRRIFELADGGDSAVLNMRVRALVSAMPGYGKKRTALLMHRLCISENRRVGGLGNRQREALLAALVRE